MRIGLLAKKVGMSRFYDSAGLNHPVTILEVDNCQIIGINTLEKNGYKSVRLSSGSIFKHIDLKYPNKYLLIVGLVNLLPSTALTLNLS